MAKRERDRRRERMVDRQKRSGDERGKRGSGNRRYLKLENANGDISWFKPGKRNLITIVPFEVKNPEYAELRTAEGNTPIGVRVGDLDYKLEIPLHRDMGPEKIQFICPKCAVGKRCFPCEQKEGLDWVTDKKERKALNISWRNMYNILDLNAEEEEEIGLWEVSYELYEREMLDEIKEVEIDTGTRPVVGVLTGASNVRFRGVEKTIPLPDGKTATFYEFKSFSFIGRKDLSERILDDVHPLDLMYEIPSYEQTKSWYLGQEMEPEAEEREETSQRQSRYEKDDEPPADSDDQQKEEPRTSSRELGWDNLDDMDKDEMLEFMKSEGIRIRSATRMTEKNLRKALAKERPAEKKEEKMSRGGKGGTKDNPCPEGFKWGEDCDSEPACDNCDVWSDCAAEQDRLKKK